MKVLTAVIVFVGMLGIVGCGTSSSDSNRTEQLKAANGITELDKLIKHDSLNHELLVMRAKAHLETGSLNKAIHDINKSLQINSNYVDAYLTLADIYFAMGLPDNCNTALLRAMVADRDDTRIHIKLAELNLLIQNHTLAMGYIDQALDISSYNPEAYYVLAMLFMSRKDTVQAIRNFQLALNQKEDFYEPLIQLGTIYSVQRNPLAEQYLRNAIYHYPQSLQARYQLALYYQDNGMLTEAESHYDTILMRQPGNKHVLFNLGYVNMVYRFQFEKAISYFEEALVVDPNYVDALYNKGRSLEELGRLMAARDVYREVLERRSNYPLAIEGLNRIDGKRN
jgi:protein O-GlcNAc transferase